MSVAVSGPLNEAKKAKRVAIVYGKLPTGSTPEIDNAYAIYFDLMGLGYDATIMTDSEWDPYVYDWTVLLGGPCTNSISKAYKGYFPDRFQVTSTTGCIYYPCRIITSKGVVLSSDSDGVVTTARIGGRYITLIAGCTRTGTDYATFVFAQKLREGGGLVKALKYITIGTAFAAAGYLIGKHLKSLPR